MNKQLDIVEEAEKALKDGFTQKEENDKKVADYLMKVIQTQTLAFNYEKAMQLYSWRVISPEQFIERIEEIDNTLE